MSQNVEFSLIGAAVLALALILLFRLVRGDHGIRVSRLGVFIQRERFPADQDDDPDDTREWPAS